MAASETITVEQALDAALKELQFIFPESPTHQIIVTRGRGLTEYRAAAGALAIFHGDTLTDCMAQVRKWREEQGEW